MKTNTTLAQKLWKLALVSALFLLPALHQARAASVNPCPRGGCGYTYDPVSKCCISDPRFDCFDICF